MTKEEYSIKKLEKEFEDLKNNQQSKKDIINGKKESYSYGNIRMTRFADGSLKKEIEDGSGWVIHLIKTVKTTEGTQIEEYYRNNFRRYDADGNMIYRLKQESNTVSISSGTACKKEEEEDKKRHLAFINLFNIMGKISGK